jgi:hypothetical protein
MTLFQLFECKMVVYSQTVDQNSETFSIDQRYSSGYVSKYQQMLDVRCYLAIRCTLNKPIFEIHPSVRSLWMRVSKGAHEHVPPSASLTQ